MKKKCISCGNEKDLSEFYKHSMMSDGRLNKCKTCCKVQAKERESWLRANDPDWVWKERERCTKKAHKYRKPVTLEQGREKDKRFYAKYPEKKNARNKTSELKTIVKGNHLHHWSYNDEHLKDVIELNRKDHNKIHRYLTYSQEHFMYKTSEGALLDTKEKHLLYITKVINNL